MDEVLIVSGWVLGAASLALFGWALFWDRSRGRRRCRGCWYDMRDAGPAPARCTECGREWKTERSMQRTRRRWRWALAAVVLAVVGVVVGLTPTYRAGRIMTLLPAWALAEMVPLFPSVRSVAFPAGNHPGYELIQRLVESEPSGGMARPGGPRRSIGHAEIVGVLRRMADGNAVAPAGSERWMGTTGDWLTGQMFRFQQRGGARGWQYPDGTPADAALTDAMERLHAVYPLWKVRTREAWAAGDRVKIETGFQRPRWHQPMSEANEDAVWSVRGTDLTGQERGFISHFTLPPLGEAGDEIVLDLTLRLYKTEVWDRSADEAPVREEDFVLRWTVTERPAVEVVDGPEIQAAIVAGLIAGVGGDVVPREFDGRWLAEEFDGIGFGVKVELFAGEEFLASGWNWWLAKDGEWVERIQGDLRVTEDYQRRINAAIAAGTLRVRATGEAGQGMTLLDADRVWEGSVEALVTDAQAAAEDWRPGRPRGPQADEGPED